MELEAEHTVLMTPEGKVIWRHLESKEEREETIDDITMRMSEKHYK